MTDEHGTGDLSYPVVRAYAAKRKPRVRASAGRRPAEVFAAVPPPGDEAAVDFGEVLKGHEHAFLEGHEHAFLEGHERAFRLVGGFQPSKVRYDNPEAAPGQVIGFSWAVAEVHRWTSFRTH